ncbi:MAG: NmrA family NAD(P)-binding protein, partial [Proteobacteria bacterium]|nr:NmrA family NAD(P)-binding protein [Pseudomonadota bacterium]
FSSVLLDQQYDNKDGPIPSRNLEIIKNLVQAMEEAGTQRIIFLSALGVSRHADSLYCQEKYQAEAMILNSKIPEKIILRSALAYSDISYRDRLVTAVESLMRFPWFYPVPRSKEKLAPIHVQDLSEMIWRLINQPMTCSAQILEVAGQQELSLEEVFRLVSKGVGKGTQVPLKGFLGEALTPIFERIYRNSRPNGPNLRELLTINKKRDPATSINGPFSTELNSLETHSFREAMKPVSQLIQ